MADKNILGLEGIFTRASIVPLSLMISPYILNNAVEWKFKDQTEWHEERCGTREETFHRVVLAVCFCFIRFYFLNFNHVPYIMVDITNTPNLIFAPLFRFDLTP